jgi:hypothetical protein
MTIGFRFGVLSFIGLAASGFPALQVMAENNTDNQSRYFISQDYSPTNKNAPKNNGDCGPTCVALEPQTS